MLNTQKKFGYTYFVSHIRTVLRPWIQHEVYFFFTFHERTRRHSTSPLKLSVVRALHEQPSADARVPVDHRRRPGGHVGRRGGEWYRLVPERSPHHRHELGVALKTLHEKKWRKKYRQKSKNIMVEKMEQKKKESRSKVNVSRNQDTNLPAGIYTYTR